MLRDEMMPKSGKSLGGQAVWDARDYLGRRVASGVYLIYATSQATFEAPDAIIAKVVIMNKILFVSTIYLQAEK